jgi:EpsD family peptidyl-prolyl cis-trans isomerase
MAMLRRGIDANERPGQMVMRYLAIPRLQLNVSRLVTVIPVICVALTVLSCSRQSSGQDVVSGKGGFEVPRAELEQANASAAANGIHEPQSVLLQRIVDQKLFAQEARREKLDRDLSVVQAIEAAKRSILASAYAQRLIKAIPPPSEDRIADFYNDHPQLFSARNILGFDEIAVSGDPGQILELKTKFTASGGKLDALQAILARRGFVAPILHVERAPEDIDMAVASHFDHLKIGDTLVYQLPKDTHFAVVTSVQPSPLSLLQAEPQIRNLLVNQAQRELVGKEVARLKAAANLTYAKGFAPSAGS